MTRERKTLAWIFVAIVVAAALILFAANKLASDQADTNYENQLVGCHRNNTPREAITLIAEGARDARLYEARHTTGARSRVAAKAAGKYARAARDMTHQAHARPDGSIRCSEAITHP